jgi:hypothetical protein
MLLTTLLLLSAQETWPKEDHAWLRYKPGTFIQYRVTTEFDGKTNESTQTLTLKEIKDDKYLVEDTDTSLPEGTPPTAYWNDVGTRTGKETLTVLGNEIPCSIWTTRGTKGTDATVSRWWIPDGAKHPVRFTFKQGDLEGDLKAVALDDPVKVGDRTFRCSKLEGTAGFGKITIWISHDVPGGQVRLDLAMKTDRGVYKSRSETVKIEEKK